MCNHHNEENCQKHHNEWKMPARIICTLIVFVCLIIIKPNHTLKLAGYIIAYIIIAYDVIINAFKNVLSKHFFDENFLMSIATFGAFLIGEYPEALMVMMLYQTGEYFCHRAVEKSKKSISDLMNIKPEIANVEIDGKIVQTNPLDVKINDIIVVKPGEKIPLDGTVLEGFASIDTSNLTGEAIPRNISPTNEVMSGCIVLNGMIKIKVEKEFKNSTVSKILDMVANAASKKAKTENFITKFAKIYTPIVVSFAIILAFVVPLCLGEFPVWHSVWFKRALFFLVISCPCALAISIPLGFFAGIGRASLDGILIKGGNYLETSSNAKTIAFDKTGTLTKGRFQVSDIFPAKDANGSEIISKDELLKIAAYAEHFSNHPIAQSIKSAYKENIDISYIKNIKEFAGLGVTSDIFNKNTIVGNYEMLQKFNIDIPILNIENTSLFIAQNNNYLGCITVSDDIKDDAQNTITNLKKSGIKKTVMLTGDTEASAQRIQNKLNIDEIYYNLLPNQKVEVLENLMKLNKPSETLIYVGDGINDAPVLARADIGIAMGKIGSDAAIEACDIVIMDDKLEKINKTVEISKKTLRIVKENIVFILSVKILFLIFGAVGLVSMWGAVFADVGTSIISIINSLRILGRKI